MNRNQIVTIDKQCCNNAVLFLQQEKKQRNNEKNKYEKINDFDGSGCRRVKQL